MRGYPLAASLDSALSRARALLPWLRRGPRSAREDLFARIQRRFIWWYSFILLGALALCGVALYVALNKALLDPIPDQLAAVYKLSGNVCLRYDNGPKQYISFGSTFYLVCFDSSGTLQQPPFGDSNVPTNITSVTAVKHALQSSPTPIIDTANVPGTGPVERYTMTVQDLLGNTAVVQIVTPISQELNVLQLFLTLLLGVGLLALLAAVLGGLFLARRALAPARLAFARQQSFIADASHELRTPLTLLRADAEVLLRGNDRLTPDDRLLLEDIVTETAHMTALAGTMLTLARLDAGRLHLERDVVDLAAVATRVAHRAGALAREKGVAIQVEGIAPLLVIGDHLLLEQVTLILVDNAIKYNHPDGQVILRTSSGGTEAILEVCDTGIGIAQEHLPHLGERFYRVDKARSREAGGAGLGLSIARGVASAHGGALTLSSTPGAGTVARLSVPATGEGRRATGDR